MDIIGSDYLSYIEGNHFTHFNDLADMTFPIFEFHMILLKLNKNFSIELEEILNKMMRITDLS